MKGKLVKGTLCAKTWTLEKQNKKLKGKEKPPSIECFIEGTDERFSSRPPEGQLLIISGILRIQSLIFMLDDA